MQRGVDGPFIADVAPHRDLAVDFLAVERSTQIALGNHQHVNVLAELRCVALVLVERHHPVQHVEQVEGEAIQIVMLSQEPTLKNVDGEAASDVGHRGAGFGYVVDVLRECQILLVVG